MRESGQITSNILIQASWRLYEIRKPSTSLCTTSNSSYPRITSNFLMQASWRLYEIRKPPTSLFRCFFNRCNPGDKKCAGWGLGLGLGIGEYMMSMMVVVPVTMIIMRKNMIVMIMMLDGRQMVHSIYKGINILNMSKKHKKSYNCCQLLSRSCQSRLLLSRCCQAMTHKEKS